MKNYESIESLLKPSLEHLLVLFITVIPDDISCSALQMTDRKSKYIRNRFSYIFRFQIFSDLVALLSIQVVVRSGKNIPVLFYNFWLRYHHYFPTPALHLII